MGAYDAFDAHVGPADDSALAEAMDRREDELKAACWSGETSPYDYLDEAGFDAVLTLAVQCAAPDTSDAERAVHRAKLDRLIRLRVELHALAAVAREFGR